MSSIDATRRTSDFPSILAASFGIGAFGVALGLTYPLLALLLAGRGVEPQIIGLNAAAMGVGILISTVAMSHLTARLHPGTVITLSLFGSAAIILAFGFTDDLWTWFALRVALGFAVNAVFVLTEAWVNEASTDEIRGRAVSGYTMALTTGFALGPLGVPLLGTQTALPFAACAVVVSATAIGVALLSRRARTQIGQPPAGAIRRFVVAAPLLVLMVMAFGFSDWTVISMMPLYFLEKGLDAASSSATVSVVHLGMILFALPTGFALDRLPRMTVGATCAALTAGCFALLPSLPSDGWSIWLALLLLGGSSVGVYTTALTLMGERFAGGMLMAGSAVYSMSYTIAGTVGMVGGGVVMDQLGYEAVPIGFALCFALLLIAIILSARPRRSL